MRKGLTEREAESHEVAGEVDRIQTEAKYRSLQAAIYITALAVTRSFGRILSLIATPSFSPASRWFLKKAISRPRFPACRRRARLRSCGNRSADHDSFLSGAPRSSKASELASGSRNPDRATHEDVLCSVAT
jgi:hypothetical protein